MVPWESVTRTILSGWAHEPGSHVTVIGPTGSGKTHLALTVAELRPYILVLAAKRQDPLVRELQRKGYHVTQDLGEILWTQTQDGQRHKPVYNKVVFWPRPPEQMEARQRLLAQAAAHRKAMRYS